jgi:hypothetical protein
MNWKRLLCLLVVLTAVAIGVVFAVDRWRHGHDEAQMARRYSGVVAGMTVDQVRQVMGRNEDQPDERQTTTGEFERSWTFENGVRFTIVFDKDGHSFYIELAPDYCGNTPLMGKYIKE